MADTDTITIREHTTASIPFTLYQNDVVINVSSSDHIEFQMIDDKKKVYRYSTADNSAYIAIVSGTLGYVAFTPPSYDTFQYIRSPYKTYCWVFDTSGVKYSVPRDSYATINVIREY